MSEPAPRIAQAFGGGTRPPSGPKPRSLPLVLSRDEVAGLMRCALERSALDHALVSFLYYTGARRSEAAGLQWGGVDWARNRVRFWRPKTRDWHEMPMHERLEWSLGRLGGLGARWGGGHVFVGQRGPLSANALWRRVRACGEEAGLPKEKCRPHVLRHSVSAHMLDAGIDLATVQAVLGHRDIRTTQSYLHVAEGATRAAVSAL